MSYQSTTVVGNVGQDPEIKYDPQAQAIVTFSVAVNKVTGQGENRKQTTTWFNVTVWGEYGETVQKYVHKGDLILVTGEVSTFAWADQKGNLRASLQIKAADEVRFLSSRKSADQGELASSSEVPETEDVPF